KGAVWSFTTELFAYAIENVTATASSEAASRAAENTVNGSGLDEAGLLHGKQGDDNMWLSDIAGPQPSWIQFEFDGVYKLHELWVWNSNDSLEPMIGFGFKDVTVEYSANGTDYTTLGTTHEFARAPGAPDYAHDTTIDMGGVPAKYVRLTANSNWGGILPQFGLSEVRFLHIPVSARNPNPESGATGVAPDVVLSWNKGREAVTHDVYVGTDEQAVIDGTAPVATVTEASHGPLSLDLGVTHYWKVNEVNDAETPTTWEGAIWSFMTNDHIVVDDFESYNDLDPSDPESKRIFNVWIDGFGIATNGSLVGYENPPFAETTIIHGGKQSMPFFYGNTGGAASSEAELTLSPAQDWTASGAQILALYFHGAEGNTGQMYVKINGTKVTYDGQASNLALPSWQVWNIDLASVGTNLQNVTKLAVGIEGNGAAGTLYFDDIGLYAVAPAPVNEWRIAAGSDDAEENLTAGGIDLGSSDLELAYENTNQGNPQIIGVRFAGIPIPKGATITDAWVRFRVDETKGGTQPVNLIIEGELSLNPVTFSATVNDISNRPKTTAQVPWSVPNWTTVGAQGPDQTTPSINPIIQEIVNQNGWAGGSIVLIFRDDPANPSLGVRCAVAGPGDNGVLLHIEYQ
ncbi:MAG: discoidin domain-containing protein, partial [Planctomycetota bacterium]